MGESVAGGQIPRLVLTRPQRGRRCSGPVRFLPRHPASIVLVLTALLATVSVFVFAGPHPGSESTMIDFTQQRYYSPETVQRAFAAQGIRLRYVNRFAGMTLLSMTTAAPADTLNVMVGPRKGHGSWGPKLQRYDERFGNVLVTYGGSDERLLDRIGAAVASLAEAP
jgi:hypothetical protein